MEVNMESICFCGREKRADRLVCPRCFELYRQKTGGKISLVDWVETEARARLKELGVTDEDPKTNLERDLKEKREELQTLRQALPEQISLTLKERLAGAGALKPEELEAFRTDIRKELWAQKGGNRLYATVKSLQTEVKVKVTPIRETLKQVGQIKKEQSAVDKVINCVLPH